MFSNKKDIISVPLFDIEKISGIEKQKVLELVRQQKRTAIIGPEVNRALEEFIESGEDIVEIKFEGKADATRYRFRQKLREKEINEIICTKRGDRVFLLQRKLIEQ